MALPDNFRFNLYYLQMPRFYESSSEETVDKSEASEKQSGDKDMKYWRIFLILVFCYYFISCGVERIYQVLVMIISSAANRLIGEVVQSRRRPLLGPSPG